MGRFSIISHEPKENLAFSNFVLHFTVLSSHR